MMKNLYTILLTALLALVSLWAKAQKFDNLTIAEASSVCSIAQDDKGILWFGTDAGLFAYDGYRIISPTQNSKFAIGEADNSKLKTQNSKLTSTRIHSMLMLRNVLYMATERGPMVYDIRRGRFEALSGSAHGEMRAVTMYGGRVWFGGAQGLFSIDTKSREMRTENTRLRNVYSLLATKHGLLVGTIAGLSVLRGARTHAIRIGEGHQPLVNALFGDGSTAWIGTEGALYRYDGRQMQTVGELNGNSVKSLSVHADNIYAGTDNGLYIYNKVTRRVTHALHDSRSPRSIANNIVWAVFSDRWGNLWAGTDLGVSCLRQRKFFNYTQLSDITNTGEGNCLHLIHRGTDGRLWLGGTNGLISYSATHGFMPESTAELVWFRQSSPTHYMSHNRVRRVYTDLDGRVIVCTDHGLNIYNPQTRQLRNVVVVDPTRRYSTAWAYDIIDDGRGRYWICSYMGGVFIIEKQRLLAAATPVVVADRHIAKQLQGIHVWQLAKDRKGRIYARMYDNGLDRIDPASLRVEHVVGKDRLVNSLISDRRGNVWAAMDGEIRCFGADNRSDRSFRIAGYGGRPADMLCEVEGDIWAVMGSDCCIIGSDGRSTRFAVPGFRPLAICYDPVSRCVLLGGNDAIVSIPTANVNTSTSQHLTTSPLFLSGLTVDGRQFATDEGSPTYLSEVTLTSKQNNLTFQLTDLPLSGQQSCVYAYRLEGVDRAWQYMHGERLDISYNALPPGKYTLEVRQVDGLGEARHEVLSYGVTILPPWYLSVWAKAVYFIALVCLALAIMNFYMMRRRLREEREAKERIMQESSARSAFFENLSLQLKKPLASVFASVLDMLHSASDTSEVRSLEQMRRNVVDMNQLVYNALDMQQGGNANEPAAKTAVDIADFCRRAADDARSKYGKAVEIAFRTNVPKAYVDADVIALQLAVEQLIGFAADNRNGEEAISIGVSADAEKVSVVVDIPGLTIAKADMPFVFNRYYSPQHQHLNASPSHHLTTLAFVHEFAERNGVQNTVESDECATSVTLVFAVKHSTAQNSELNNSQSAQPTTQNSQFKTQNSILAQPTIQDSKLKTQNSDSADARLLAKITETVEAHIADSEFNVTRLQETLGLGSKLLYRKVKQMTGKTPVEFIRHIRMQRAAILLRDGRFSVSEVMYMVGFSNSSYFSKVFQKTYGITPTDYSHGQ